MAGEQNIVVQQEQASMLRGEKTITKQDIAREITPQKRLRNLSTNYRIHTYMSARVTGIIISHSKYEENICEKHTGLISTQEATSEFTGY